MPETILPSEILANCRAYAEQNSVNGMGIFDMVAASCPNHDLSGDGDDYEAGEMVVQAIFANSNIIDDDQKIDADSMAFIAVLDKVTNDYDIANYVWKDGRVWAVQEGCWAEEV